jgi:hypothetical protein
VGGLSAARGLASLKGYFLRAPGCALRCGSAPPVPSGA